MAGSSGWRPFRRRFHSKIVLEGMKMTAEERRREQRASRERLGGVWGAPGRHFGGHMAKSTNSSYLEVVMCGAAGSLRLRHLTDI